MSRYSILIDVTKCNGCYNCFLACRDEYYGNDYLPYSAAQPLNDQFWLKMKEIDRYLNTVSHITKYTMFPAEYSDI